jgi:thiamine-phosphate pyrophosphorylase
MICAVSDRRRRDVLALVRDAAAAGVDLVQIRERDLPDRSLAALVARAVDLTRGTATRILVNDRLDVALCCGADGVHLRSDSLPAASARTIAPRGFLIGRSVHHADEVPAAGPVDYVIAGTVFATPSKPQAAALLGVDGLRRIAASARVPVLAIGGVTLSRFDELARAGARGAAAIGLFDGSAPFAPIVAAARAAFDSVNTAS